MDALLSALLEAGLIDADTADIMRRQDDQEAARAWAETTLTTAAQGALSAQQQRLIYMLRDTDYRPTERDVTWFWDNENELLWDAMRPRIMEVLNERSTFAAVVGGNAGTFSLVNQQVIQWAETYYVDPSDTTYGSIPNLNLTSRQQFADAFAAWNRGELGGRADGLPQLIRALVPTFGADRAERIAVTETTRLFTESIRQAGLANPFTTAFRVLTANDERVCPICGGVYGAVVAKTDANGFVHPVRGSIGFPPFHVKCRCGITEETEQTLRLRPQAGQQPPATGSAQEQPATEPTPEPVTPTSVRPLFQYQPSQEQLDRVVELIDKALARSAQRNKVSLEEFERGVEEGFRKLLADKDLAIQFPSNVMDLFLADPRFKTQFETNSSGGALNHDYRANAEFYGLGAPLSLNPKDRPIYGYVNVAPIARKQVSQYGDLTFILKNEVRDRATVTMDDSLYNFAQSQVAGTPINNPNKASWDGQFTSLYQYNKTGNLNYIYEEIPYVEVQIQGQVTIADVRGIIDDKGRLTAEQRKRLEELGVEVWDKAP